MMGRKLTEDEKVERAAKKIEAKRRDELGPLFAHQAEPVDRQQLKAQRRMVWAGLVDHYHWVLEEASEWLDRLQIQQLEETAREYLPAEVVDRLAAYARRTYPADGYLISFWLGVLAGDKRVATTLRVEFLDPPKTFPSGGNNGHMITVDRRVIEEDILPPEGWKSPFGPEWKRSAFWRQCDTCKRWHAPGQVECIGAAIVDDVALDADAEAVLASIQTHKQAA